MVKTLRAQLRHLFLAAAVGFGTLMVAQPASATWEIATPDNSLTEAQTGCIRVPGAGWHCPTLQLACQVAMTGWWSYSTWPTNLFDIQMDANGKADCVIRPYCCSSSGARYHASPKPVCAAGQEGSSTSKNGCRGPGYDRANGSCSNVPNGRPNFAGNRVNVANGNKFEAVVDFRSEGPEPLEFIRYYNSGQTFYFGTNAMARTSLGASWASNYHRRLELTNSNTAIVYRSESGRATRFTKSGSVWLPADTDDPVRLVANGTSTFVVTDENGRVETFQQGSMRFLLSIQERNGYTRTATVSFPLRLPGQYFDAETGLHYNYQRDYDPALGRYIQADPLGPSGGFNRYSYALANPMRFTDPTGEVVPVLAGLALGGYRAYQAYRALRAVRAALAATTPSAVRQAVLSTGVSNSVLTAASSKSGSRAEGKGDKQCRPDEDDPCEQLLRIDTDTCNAITRLRGRRAGQRCHAMASQRYAECLRHGIAGVRTPLDAWNN